MPENPSESPEAENVRAIRQLVRLMKRYDLTAIDFVEGSTQIRLRRRGPEVRLHGAAPSRPRTAGRPPRPRSRPCRPPPAAPAAPAG